MATDNTVRIFSARACAEPLYEAARDFEDLTGSHVSISVCARHCAKPEAEEASGQMDDFLVEISDLAIHDLAIGGAEFLLDDGEVRGIVQKGQRRTIAYRASALVVPVGNPAGIASIWDVTRPGVRIAISMIDCLKGVWEDITARWHSRRGPAEYHLSSQRVYRHRRSGGREESGCGIRLVGFQAPR